jgi:hypothetical protein
LADFYFAGESGDLSGVTDVQPRIKSFWSFWPRFNSGSGFLRRRVKACHAHNQTSTQQLEEIAPLELKAMPQA